MNDNFLPHILAKSKPEDKPETLVQHTDKLIFAWLELKRRYQPVLELDETFWFQSFLSILFHDLGKLTQNFQDSIQSALDPKYKRTLPHIRHEFISGMVLIMLNKLKFGSYNLNFKETIFAVLTHHKSFNKRLFLSDIDIEKPWRISQTDFDNFLEYARDRISTHGFMRFLDILKDMENIYTPLSNLLLLQFHQLLFGQDSQPGIIDRALTNANNELRIKYILQKSLLVASDWSASGHRPLEKPLVYSHQNIYDEIEKRAKEKNITFKGFRKFQLQAGTKKGNVLAIAPTGSGKTEASLLWAANRENGWEKIVYLLPTRVTANSLYKRMHSYFGKADEFDNYAAVVHSSAKMFRQDLDDNYDEFNYLRESAFFKAITICSVDQVLTQGFNVGRWELKTFHLYRAKVVIDEVHAYAPYTLGLLIASIKYLRQHFQTQFFIMTATMPKQLQILLTDALGNDVEIVPDKELLKKSRNKYRVEDKTVDELFPEIRKRIKSGKKILLVVNTVNEAIRLFDEFKDLDRFCYHSRFMVRDRTKKEELIEEFEKSKEGKGFLLIATQVVEVSLDIDYDFLYTENAPIDALIQRAGRVNRKRSKRRTEIVVFRHLPITERIYEVPNILTNTFNFLAEKAQTNPKMTEHDLLDLVDKVYESWEITAQSSYKEALGKHENIIKNFCSYVMDFDDDYEKILTREGLDTITIIPMSEKNNLVGQKPKEKLKFEVTIRRKLFQIIKSHLAKRGIIPEKDSEGFTYLDVPYTFEKGLFYSFEEAKEMYPKDPFAVFE